MSQSIKRIDPKEFQEFGFLQEANRQFFHPCGLALEVLVKDDGTVVLGGIWDYRDDPEGIVFGKEPDPDKALRVSEEWMRHREARIRLMGATVQPLDWALGQDLAPVAPAAPSLFRPSPVRESHQQLGTGGEQSQLPTTERSTCMDGEVTEPVQPAAEQPGEATEPATAPASAPETQEAPGEANPEAPTFTDAEALDQIAALLGLYTTDPGNNPVNEVLADITSYVQNTGRSTSTGEGA